jgi:hypothetical protein
MAGISAKDDLKQQLKITPNCNYKKSLKWYRSKCASY